MRRNHGTVVAYLGLFIALGGVSYAAINLQANSVGTKQLKRNAVVSSKVKDHSLAKADFKAGQLPRGATGPTGPAGTPANLQPGPAIAFATATPACQSQPGSLCQTPTFQPGDPHWGSVSEFDGTYPPAAYLQDKSGFVHLQGAVQMIAAFGVSEEFPIFYLPTALRPADGLRQFWTSSCDGTTGISVKISLDGSAMPEPFGGCLSLDGISFHP